MRATEAPIDADPPLPLFPLLAADNAKPSIKASILLVVSVITCTSPPLFISSASMLDKLPLWLSLIEFAPPPVKPSDVSPPRLTATAAATDCDLISLVL